MVRKSPPPDLIRGWMPVFGRDHAQTRKHDGRADARPPPPESGVDGVVARVRTDIANRIAGNFAAEKLGPDGTRVRPGRNTRQRSARSYCARATVRRVRKAKRAHHHRVGTARSAPLPTLRNTSVT